MKISLTHTKIDHKKLNANWVTSRHTKIVEYSLGRIRDNNNIEKLKKKFCSRISAGNEI